MQNDQQGSLVPVSESTELEKSIDSFNLPLSNFIKELGLPTDNVLTPIEERKKVISSLGQALSILPINDREKSYYLTKFTVAISVGLGCQLQRHD